MGISFSQLLLILVLLVAVFMARRFLANRAEDGESLSAQVSKARTEKGPVAETAKGKEAEFVRDRLPSRWPIVVGLVIVAVLGATTWLSFG